MEDAQMAAHSPNSLAAEIECMKEMLQQQLVTNKVAYPYNSALAVVVRIPRVDDKYMGREESVLILWAYIPLPQMNDTPTYPSLRTQSIPVPYEVISCGQAVISCTERFPVRGFKDLLLELFVRGYGDAALRSDYDPKSLPYKATLIDIRQIAQSDTTPPRQLATNSTMWSGHWGTAPTQTPVDIPIFCLVHFPPFRRHLFPALKSRWDKATVCALGPYHSNAIQHYEVSHSIENFNKCTVQLQFPPGDIDFREVLDELIDCGCYKEDFVVDQSEDPPSFLLPCGARIIGLRIGPSFEHHDAFEDYQTQLRILNDYKYDRLLMALGYKEGLAEDASTTPANPTDSTAQPEPTEIKEMIERVDSLIANLLRSFPPAQAKAMLRRHSAAIKQTVIIHTPPGVRDSQQDLDMHIAGLTDGASLSQNPVYESSYSPRDQLAHNNHDFTVLPALDNRMLAQYDIDPSTTLMHSAAASPMSLFGSPASFMTASSPASFMTARSTYASPAIAMMLGPSPTMRIQTIREDEAADASMSAPLKQLLNEYHTNLRQQNIIQPFDKELNWSGKGQHVMFLPKGTVPLVPLASLGASMTAKVDKVLCRRIALARKVMRCSRQWTIADALREVYHLQNLRHAHIVQLVGSYLQGRNFAILMYPVADCHLGTFMEDTSDLDHSHDMYGPRMTFLAHSIGCLTSAMAYVHSQTTKHMDIKPQNILVRQTHSVLPLWRVYLADFGLSRIFTSDEQSQTDGPTSRTPRYCAPEVFHYQQRGRSADIFSLGCVFSEILTTYAGLHPQEFSDYRRGVGNDESFHANLPRVADWIDTHLRPTAGSILAPTHRLSGIVHEMIHSDPTKRPTAQHIMAFLSTTMFYRSAGSYKCCAEPPEPYVAYEPTAPPLGGWLDMYNYNVHGNSPPPISAPYLEYSYGPHEFPGYVPIFTAPVSEKQTEGEGHSGILDAAPMQTDNDTTLTDDFRLFDPSHSSFDHEELEFSTG
jgi:serine/threonine protein kinase